MNKIFSPVRFLNLMKKTLLERPIQLFGITLMVLALVLLIYSSCRNLLNYESTQIITFFLGLIGGGYFLAAAVFGYFTSNAKGSGYLLLPASVFEKWLCSIIIIVVLYVPLFLGFYRLMDSILVEIYRNNLPKDTLNYERLIEAAKIFEFDSMEAHLLYAIFYNVTGIMLVGSLYFNKLTIVNVALVICGLLFIGIGINYLFANMLIENFTQAFPFGSIYIKWGENRREINLPESYQTAFKACFKYYLPALLYLLALVRLKEKEF